MDVTSLNFAEISEGMCAAIDGCDFCAIDCEMTGLNSSSGTKNSPSDNYQARYLSVRDSAAKFLLLQYGITTFKFDQTNNRYVCRPYNVYLFPHPPSLRPGDERDDARFLCQASSVSFLCQHNFDFNKCFRHGVKHITLEYKLEKETAIRRKMEKDATPESSRSKVEIKRLQDQEFVDNCLSSVRTAKLAFEGDSAHDSFFVLPPTNGFRRRILYDAFSGEEFETVLLQKFAEDNESSRYGNQSLRAVFFSSVDDKSAFLEVKRRADMKEELEKVKEESGFSRIIEALSNAKKTVVGHNCLLDLAHTYTKFCGAPPLEFEKYVTSLRSKFPSIVDTKYCVSNDKKLYPCFTSTALGDVYAGVQGLENAKPDFVEAFRESSEVNVEFSAGFDRYKTAEFHHEAGYDSYMTGVVFLKLMLAKGYSPRDIRSLGASESLDASFHNRLYLMRMGGRCIDLAGANPDPDRSNWLHVTGFPLEAQTHHIMNCFKPYKGKRVYWLDDENLFVEFLDDDSFPELMGLVPSTRKENETETEVTVRKSLVTLEMLSMQLFSDYIRIRTYGPKSSKRPAESQNGREKRKRTKIAARGETSEEVAGGCCVQ
eukprot:g6643.t1